MLGLAIIIQGGCQDPWTQFSPRGTGGPRGPAPSLHDDCPLTVRASDNLVVKNHCSAHLCRVPLQLY